MQSPRLDDPYEMFVLEIMRTTASLLHLLSGMNAQRQELASIPHGSNCIPRLPYLAYNVSSPQSECENLLTREGPAERLAFNGWIEEVFQLWERQYREKLRIPSAPGSIRPEADVLGDLRLIRNELIHSGTATKQRSGSCKVLKWFAPGDSIVLGLRHVLDFLNQMALLGSQGPIFSLPTGYTFFLWSTLLPEDALRSGPIPQIVSLRALMVDPFVDGEYEPMISYVFENGVHCNLRLHWESNFPESLEEQSRFVEEAVIDDRGHVCFADGNVLSKGWLYHKALDHRFGKVDLTRGRGVPGPSMRISRKPTDSDA